MGFPSKIGGGGCGGGGCGCGGCGGGGEEGGAGRCILYFSMGKAQT